MLLLIPSRTVIISPLKNLAQQVTTHAVCIAWLSFLYWVLLLVFFPPFSQQGGIGAPARQAALPPFPFSVSRADLSIN